MCQQGRNLIRNWAGWVARLASPKPRCGGALRPSASWCLYFSLVVGAPELHSELRCPTDDPPPGGGWQCREAGAKRSSCRTASVSWAPRDHPVPHLQGIDFSAPERVPEGGFRERERDRAAAVGSRLRPSAPSGRPPPLPGPRRRTCPTQYTRQQPRPPRLLRRRRPRQ